MEATLAYYSRQLHPTPPLEAALCTLESIFSILPVFWMPIRALRGRKR